MIKITKITGIDKRTNTPETFYVAGDNKLRVEGLHVILIDYKAEVVSLEDLVCKDIKGLSPKDRIQLSKPRMYSVGEGHYDIETWNNKDSEQLFDSVARLVLDGLWAVAVHSFAPSPVSHTPWKRCGKRSYMWLQTAYDYLKGGADRAGYRMVSTFMQTGKKR